MNDQKKAALRLSEFASGNALRVSTPKASPKLQKAYTSQPRNKKKKRSECITKHSRHRQEKTIGSPCNEGRRASETAEPVTNHKKKKIKERKEGKCSDRAAMTNAHSQRIRECWKAAAQKKSVLLISRTKQKGAGPLCPEASRSKLQPPSGSNSRPKKASVN